MEENDEEVTLVHCIYSSASTVEFTENEVLELLQVSRKNNAAVDVSGMLLYENSSFFQILEGHPDNVNALLEKIQNDPRHDRVTKIIFEEIEERDFAEWTMGYSELKMSDLQKVEGLNDFFKSSSCYQDLDVGRCKDLLEAFKDGKWRASLK